MGRSLGFDGVFMGPRWDFYGTFYEWGGGLCDLCGMSKDLDRTFYGTSIAITSDVCGVSVGFIYDLYHMSMMMSVWCLCCLILGCSWDCLCE